MNIILLTGLAVLLHNQGGSLDGLPEQADQAASETAEAPQREISRAEKGPVPATNPGAWVRQTDYPPLALRENMAGRVSFTLSVDEFGKPTNCTVTKSSGSDELDTVACSKLLERARFRPAQDSEGNAVPGTWSNSVKWSIRQSAPIYLERGDDPTEKTCVLLDEDPPRIRHGEDCEALLESNKRALETGSATRDLFVLDGIAPEGPKD